MPELPSGTMDALVTGGAGFIGRAIVDRLAAAGHRVTILDTLDARVHPAQPPQVPEGVELLEGSVLDPEALAASLDPAPSVVFHEAAMVGLGRGALDAEDYVRTNVTGTIRLLHAIAEQAPQARLVLASTMALYGEGAYRCPACQAPRDGHRHVADLEVGAWEPRCPTCGDLLEPVAVTEAHPPAPGTVYAISKLGQEQMARTVGHQLDIPVVALRYHNVYGPHMPRDTPYAGVAALFKARLLAGQPPLVHEDGGQLRDFVHVEDIAKANLLAAEAPLSTVADRAYNIGTGDPRPIMDLARALCDELAPELEPALSGTYRQGDARHVFASIDRARRELGYEPSILLDEGAAGFAHAPARPSPQEARP